MKNTNQNSLVISGISGKFPECDDIEELSKRIFENQDLVTPNVRWPGKTDLPKRMGIIDDKNKFDNDYFGIKTINSNYMDPSARLLLELTVQAIVDSGEIHFEKNGILS